MKVASYLLFNGNCEAALAYYAKVLGAKTESLMRNAGSPAEAHVPPEWKEKVLHARFRIGETVLMASDAPPGHQQPAGGFSLCLDVVSVAEGERIFKALAEGGKIAMPYAKTFFAAGFGMLSDRFGVHWMVSCEKE